MKPLVEWVKDPGFWVKQNWDWERGRWTEPGFIRLAEHEARILAHCFTLDPVEERFPYTTVVLSAPKKSGKTTWAAMIGSWYADQVVATEVYCLANDEEQARSRVFEDITYDLLQKGIKSRKSEVTLPNGTLIKALAGDYRGVAGSRHGLTLWDELWGYTSDRSRRLWAEMLPIPTVPYPLRVVVTYAGFEGESELLWNLYEEAYLKGTPVPELEDIVNEDGEPVCRTDGKGTFVYWDTVPRKPWQTQEYYEQQLADPSLRPMDFLRLHRNQWVTSEEEFIAIQYWDKAAVLNGPVIYDTSDDRRNLPVSVGVDASTKHDTTAVVGCYYDASRKKVGIAFHRIWKPAGGIVDLSEVEDYILTIAKVCHINTLVYDPTQLHQMMTNMAKRGFKTVEFSQNSKQMSAATQHLYELFVGGNIEVYPNDELRNHIKFAKVEIKGGVPRLTKSSKRSKNKIDAAVALAMAAYDAVQRGGVDTTKPIIIASPFSDATAFTHKTPQQILEEKYLPEALRS